MGLTSRILPALRRLQLFTFTRDPLSTITITMASTAALTKLTAPLRDLVANAAPSDFGKSEKDTAEVTQWIDKIAEDSVAKPKNLKV